MTRKSFIARCDDLGSSRSANQAIAAVTNAGFFKNISVMAPGPAIEEAAAIMTGRKDLCFGMHTTINAEWDQIKWRPILPMDENSGLVDQNGFFLNNPAQFRHTKPAVETIMQEINAQLEKLHSLGFQISYIDTHMFPELYIEELDSAIAAFARTKGLIDHMYFYSLPPDLTSLTADPSQIADQLKQIPAGQYFYVAHPAYDTEEMRLTGNAEVSGETVAKSRDLEARLFSDPIIMKILNDAGCEGVRYDEAILPDRLTVNDLKELFSK